jgi:hypothetical protein
MIYLRDFDSPANPRNPVECVAPEPAEAGGSSAFLQCQDQPGLHRYGADGQGAVMMMMMMMMMMVVVMTKTTIDQDR